jgi:hypothetical protein
MMSVRNTLYFSYLASSIAFSVFLFSGHLTAQTSIGHSYVVKAAPIPPHGMPHNLVLLSDRPGDPLIKVQKRSLKKIDLIGSGIDENLVAQYFRYQMSRTMSDTEIDNLASGGFEVFSNFMHGMREKDAYDQIKTHDPTQFWILIWPKNMRVSSSLLQTEMFGTGIGGHAQLRLKLDAPLLLIPQEYENRLSEVLAQNESSHVISRIDGSNIKEILRAENVSSGRTVIIPGDIVYTLMALRTQSGRDSWGPLTGLTGTFANSYSVGSAAYIASIQGNHNFISQYNLEFSAEQNQKLLEYVLSYPLQEGERQIYNLIYNSCIQTVMRALNHVDQRVDAWEFSPYSVVPSLQLLGIIDPNKIVISANEEFGAPVQQLETQENKKSLELVRANSSLIQSSLFKDGLRALAYVIIEDRWTYGELDSVFSTLKKQNHLLSLPIAQMVSLVKDNKALSQKSIASIEKLTATMIQVLQKNKLEIELLLAIMNNLNGGN